MAAATGQTPEASFVASDPYALLPHTPDIYALEEGQVVEVRASGIEVASPLRRRPAVRRRTVTVE